MDKAVGNHQPRESVVRSVAKALSWQVLGLSVTGTVLYLHTGSLLDASGLALFLGALALVTYILHERLWLAIPWGRERRG